MTATAAVDYYGLKEALRELQKVSPALRKEISKEMLGIVRETMVAPIQDAIPSSAPLSGMKHNGRTSWSKTSQQKGVVAKIDTRKARRRNLQQGAEWESLGVVKVLTKTAALAITDMAGRGPNSTRNRNPKLARPAFPDFLTSKLGRGPSRFIWFAGERNIPFAMSRLAVVVEQVSDATTGRIVRR